MAATNTDIPTLDGAGTIPAYVARPDADSARAIQRRVEVMVNATFRSSSWLMGASEAR